MTETARKAFVATLVTVGVVVFVAVRDKDPAEEETPTVLFLAAKEAES
jgi:hypothetical protein